MEFSHPTTNSKTKHAYKSKSIKAYLIPPTLMVTGLDIAQKCTVPKLAMHGLSCHEMTTAASGSDARDSETYGEVLALRAHCVHIAHAEAGILTQEYLSPV